ncbi:MAG: flippase-like domain-containing protein, partial [Victivallales bacterium]|nr:flippase-like domain-containing protein [Victivallales bacterium]
MNDQENSESTSPSASASNGEDESPGINHPADAPEKKRNYFWFALRMGIAIGIITWLVASNYDSFLDALKGFDCRWLIPAAALYLIHLCAGAYRWQMLLKVQNVEISFLETFSLTLQGFFFSMVIPGGSLGGDVVKAAFIVKRVEKGRKLVGAFTILMDRILGMITLFSLAGVLGFLSYGFLSKVEGGIWFFTASVVLGVVGALVAVGLFTHRFLEKVPPIGWMVDFLD